MNNTADNGWSDPKSLASGAYVYADYWLWLVDAKNRNTAVKPGLTADVVKCASGFSKLQAHDFLDGKTLMAAALREIPANKQEAFSVLAENLFSFAEGDSKAGQFPLPYPSYEAGAEPSPHGFLTAEATPDPEHACVIGLIDDTIPFAHQRLRTDAGHSRVASIWLQGAKGTIDYDGPDKPGLDLPFGQELRGEAISELLRDHTKTGTVDELALYSKAGAIDQTRASQQSYAAGSSHGSAIADLAAGFDPGDEAAKQFPIIAVSLPPEVSRDTLGTFMPLYVLVATMHIIHRTRRLCRWIEVQKGLPALSVKLPLVINLSYGLTAGPKDGTGYVAALQDQIAQSPPKDIGPISFVIPMGNHRLTRSHARLESKQSIEWHVEPDDATPSFVEIWSDPSADKTPMQLSVTAPHMAGPVVTSFTDFDQWVELTDRQHHIGRAYLQLKEQGDGKARQSITLAIPPTVPSHMIDHFGRAGIWELCPISKTPVHAYVQRDESLRGAAGSGGRQSYFNAPDYQIYDDSGRLIEMDNGASTITRYGTLNSFACGENQVRVGCERADGSTAPYSGLGFKDDKNPAGEKTGLSDRSAMRPGMLTMGLLSGSRQLLSGTSVAAPQITRQIAYDLAGLKPAKKRALAEY